MTVKAAGRGPSRSWGPWTEAKLDALEQYLRAFTIASSRARSTLYLDLFSGSASNFGRETGSPIPNSVERALSIQPPFGRVVGCDLDPAAVSDLRAKMVARFPGRDFHILDGDCNEEIPRYLSELAKNEPGWRLAPSFAFVDQYSAEVHWATLESVAQFRLPNASGRRRKTELWLYLGDSFIPRGLSTVDRDLRSELNPSYASRVDAMYGTAQWREFLWGRQNGYLTAAEWKQELVNFMRWRLEQTLGYKVTIPLAVTKGSGQVLYHMIFATDEPVGDRIMTSVLRGAGKALGDMQARTTARRLNSDPAALIEVLPAQVASRQIRSIAVEPPWVPWRAPLA